MLAELWVPLTNTFLIITSRIPVLSFQIREPHYNIPASQTSIIIAVTQLYPLQNINRIIQLPIHVFHKTFTCKPTRFSLAAIVSDSLRKTITY
jgi:hypothetical protein